MRERSAVIIANLSAGRLVAKIYLSANVHEKIALTGATGTGTCLVRRQADPDCPPLGKF